MDELYGVIERLGIEHPAAQVALQEIRYLESILSAHVHHVVSRYSNATRGWARNWSELARAILAEAGVGVESQSNKLRLPGHWGPHPELYHRVVFERLQRAAEGRTGAELTEKVRQELQKIMEDLLADPSRLSGVGL
jgi:hypothetical protein